MNGPTNQDIHLETGGSPPSFYNVNVLQGTGCLKMRRAVLQLHSAIFLRERAISDVRRRTQTEFFHRPLLGSQQLQWADG